MSDKEHTEGCWCGEWHDPEKFAVECTAPAPQPATEEMAKEYLRRMGIPNEPLLFLPEKDIYTAELLVGFAASVGSLAATAQVTPTPLEEMCDSAIELAAELRQELRHAVMCMDRSCKQCNAIAKRFEDTAEQAPPAPDKREAPGLVDSCPTCGSIFANYDPSEKCRDGWHLNHNRAAATPQVTPTPLTPRGIVSACSQTLAFQWLTDNGYPTAAMSQKRGYTAFQLAPILEAYWNWRKPSLDPKGD
jgi:hypothetical protein